MSRFVIKKNRNNYENFHLPDTEVLVGIVCVVVASAVGGVVVVVVAAFAAGSAFVVLDGLVASVGVDVVVVVDFAGFVVVVASVAEDRIGPAGPEPTVSVPRSKKKDIIHFNFCVAFMK